MKAKPSCTPGRFNGDSSWVRRSEPWYLSAEMGETTLNSAPLDSVKVSRGDQSEEHKKKRVMGPAGYTRQQ